MISYKLKLAGCLVLSLLAGSTVMASQSDIQVDVIEGNMKPRPPLFGTDPEDVTNSGTAMPGLLTIDRVPNLHFGKVVASGLYQKEYALNANPYVQVSDFRGSLGGWTLSAKISDFVSTPAPEDTRRYLLGGAALKISMGNLEAYHSEYAPPPISYSVTLNKDFQKVAAAAENTGQGIWASRWQSSRAVNDKIELAILPGTAEPNRQYQATMSWKLADVPNN